MNIGFKEKFLKNKQHLIVFSQMNQKSLEDIFIYLWIVEDDEIEIEEKEYPEYKLKVRGYGLNTNNSHLYIELKENYFRPWLTVEVMKDKTETVNIHQLKLLLQKFSRDIRYISEEQFNRTSISSLPPVFFCKSRFNKKLYFYEEESDSQNLLLFQIYFNTLKARRQFYYNVQYNMKEYHRPKIKVHDFEANPMLQFISQFDLPSVGWVELNHQYTKKNLPKYTRNDSKEYIIIPSGLKTKENQEEHRLPTFKVLSFDLESYSHIETKFPDSTDIRDPIFQIGLSITSVNDEENKNEIIIKNILLTLSPKKITKLEGIDEIRCFLTEKEMLKEFCKFIKTEYDPHFIIGYNIFGYDLVALNNRCKLHSIDLSSLGMSDDRMAELKELKWSSSAYMAQSFTYFDWDGRILIDMLPVIKRDHKFSNYKLKTVSTHFLGQTKDPVTVRDIFAGYRLGFLGKDIKLLIKVGKYCCQDSKLVLMLFQKLQTFISLKELASLCNVSIMNLYLNGQQLKVFSTIYRRCYNENRLVDSFKNIDDEIKKIFHFENYVGAHVFEPKIGLHSYVIPFDFTSLYPTCQISSNIDYSTLVISDKVPDEKCNIIEWNDGDKDYKFRWIKKPLGVVPRLLKDFLEARNQTKKQLKMSKDPFVKNVLNARQLSFKISANSVYGSMGTTLGYIPFLPGAMSTTAKGRKSIQYAADFVKKEFNGDIIYGDSVTKDTPIYVKYSSGDVKIMEIQNFFNVYKKNIMPYHQFKKKDSTVKNKEQILFNDDKYQIFTANKWSFIKRVIRHYTLKKIYRVYTVCGYVDVTEDHSLILNSGKEIAPSKLCPNEHSLLHFHSDFKKEIVDNLYFQKENWSYCSFQKDGYVFFNLTDHPIESKFISYLFAWYLKSYPDCVFTFFKHQNTNKYVYCLDLYNRDKLQKGLVLKIENIGKTSIMDFVYDIETSEGSFAAGNGCLIVHNTDSIYCKFKNYNNAKEAWNHAKMIENILLERKIFPSPMALLFEDKVYSSFLIFKKKKYLAITMDENGKKDKELTVRGVILTRRDNSNWCRDIYEKVTIMVMENVNYDIILETVNDSILKLFQWHPDNQNINKFVITKSLNDSYKVKELSIDLTKAKQRFLDLDIELDKKKMEILSNEIKTINKDIVSGKSSFDFVQNYINKSKPAHVQLSFKMEERGTPLQIGSRMEYVVIEHLDDLNNKGKLSNKYEDPGFFLAYCDILRLDRLYYLKSLCQSVDQVIETAFQKCPIQSIYKIHTNKKKNMNELKTIAKPGLIIS